MNTIVGWLVDWETREDDQSSSSDEGSAVIAEIVDIWTAREDGSLDGASLLGESTVVNGEVVDSAKIEGRGSERIVMIWIV